MEGKRLFTIATVMNMLSGALLYMSNNEKALHWTSIVFFVLNAGLYIMNYTYYKEKHINKRKKEEKNDRFQ